MFSWHLLALSRKHLYNVSLILRLFPIKRGQIAFLRGAGIPFLKDCSSYFVWLDDIDWPSKIFEINGICEDTHFFTSFKD